MTRWNGSLIGVQKNTSLTDSTGVWNLRKQTLAKQNGVWPLDNSTIPQPNWSLDFSSGSPWSNGTDYTFVSTTSTSRTHINSSGYISVILSNLVLQSQNFTTTWSNTNTAIDTNSGSFYTAPDGSISASKLNQNTTSGVHNIQQAITANTVTYSFSIYAKKQTTSGVGRYLTLITRYDNFSWAYSTFDLHLGTVSQNAVSTGFRLVNPSANIIDAGNGWYRCILTVKWDFALNSGFIVALADNATPTVSEFGQSFAGTNTTDGVYIWGAQVTEGSTVLPYNSTTTASNSIPRLTHDRNGSRLGLLIEQTSTNKLTQSTNLLNAAWSVVSTVVTANQGTAPDGTNTAVSLTDTGGLDRHGLSRTLQMGTGRFTGSVYMKKRETNSYNYGSLGVMSRTTAGGFVNYGITVDLNNGNVTKVFNGGSINPVYSVENAGNGWYRLIITVTTEMDSPNDGINFSPSPVAEPTSFTSGIPVYSPTSGTGILVWGPQMESISSASSYIPTVASAVTRNEDKVHITKSKITNWSSPGAVCVHFYKPLQAGTLVSTDDAATEQLGIQASSTTAARAFWSSGQTATGDIGEPVVQKAIHYWDGTTSKFCINGTTVQTGTNNVSNFNNTNFITLGAEATDSSGSPGTFSNYANCVIRKVEFYAGSLTDTNLQEITNIGNYTSQYVVVAGGGGGGYGGGGGGGAGGYLESSNYVLVPGLTYTITVGSGGVGGTSDPATGSATAGNNSSFGTISAIGGGLGARSIGNGGSGGSGGGGGGWGNGATTAGSGTAGQGNAGGNNGYPTTSGSPWAGGGGGGAGSAGTAPPVTGTGGSGGDGLSSSITGTSVTRAGGGGGAPSAAGGAVGAAGSGGGGSGATGSVAPGAGSANTGGGGGAGAGVTNLNGAAGGSGVVIIRVPTANYSSVYTGTPSISQVGDNTVLVFNASGSYRA